MNESRTEVDQTLAFGGGGFEKSTLTKDQVNKRKLKKYVKEQGNKLLEKDENIMSLEDGTIFGVKSPAGEIMAE